VNTDPLARARLPRIIHCDDVMTKVLRCGNTFCVTAFTRVTEVTCSEANVRPSSAIWRFVCN